MERLGVNSPVDFLPSCFVSVCPVLLLYGEIGLLYVVYLTFALWSYSSQNSYFLLLGVLRLLLLWHFPVLEIVFMLLSVTWNTRCVPQTPHLAYFSTAGRQLPEHYRMVWNLKLVSSFLNLSLSIFLHKINQISPFKFSFFKNVFWGSMPLDTPLTHFKKCT